MRPKPKFTEALNCRVSPELKAALDKESERRSVSSNELVRLAVEAFLAPPPVPTLPAPPPVPSQPELPPELLPRPVLAPSSAVTDKRTVKPAAPKRPAKPSTKPKAKAKARR